jgi:hypothetical protein
LSGERITSRDYRRPHRPWPLRAANRALALPARLGIEAALDEASLVRAARRRSGLHFFGDESFREPLRRVVDALENGARLHPLGRWIARETLVRLLANRLRRQALWDLHGEIRAIPVESPVFIVGLQRTGTTVLHRLLALEPALRPLLSWEALNPAPLPRARARRDGSDPRVRLAETAERALRWMAPDFFAIHPVEAHAPEEDVLLLDLCFMGTTPEASQHAPSLSRWLEEQDQRPAYRDLRGWIQLLLWQRPGRWLGKTPHHLEHLDALLSVFPDARIVQTHRDPAVVAASFCSMVCHARGVFSDAVDPIEVGRHWGRKQARMVGRAMEARDAAGSEHFLDVAYGDLVADPLKQVHRIYDFLGLRLAPETEARMQAWLAQHPQHRLGRHRYRLEDFGLDAARLEERFAAYRERFAIPREGERSGSR